MPKRPVVVCTALSLAGIDAFGLGCSVASLVFP